MTSGFYPTLRQATLAAGVVGGVIGFVQGWKRGNLELAGVIEKTIAGSAIPTGFYLIGCAFRPDWLKNISDVGLYLIAAGIALLYVSINPFWK